LKKLLLALLLTGVAAVLLWGILRKNEPPKVPFARTKRQTLVSTLPTNGKVEPFAWQPVRAETSGVVSRVAVEDGQQVAAGASIASISDPSLQADLEAAQARVNEARANLNALEAGGKPAEFTQIENDLARARLDLEQYQRTLASLQRLAEKHAATQQEVDATRDKVQQTQVEIAGLDKRRRSLVSTPDVTVARARLADAESAVRLAQQRESLSAIRAPMSGTVYGREIRQGSYVNAGDLIANIGRMDRLRVRVYVDEPELGRVVEGQPVAITWDALPGRQWQGQVEKKPAAIQAYGSRQVGEVLCAIENQGRVLIPGTNVNAEIRTAVVENALVVPKETLRHDAQGDYVFALKGDTIERRAVKKGVSSITQVQILDGITDNDAVALPSDISLKAGDRVTATM
jgi:HlyD family secretion protein